MVSNSPYQSGHEAKDLRLEDFLGIVCPCCLIEWIVLV